MVNKEIIGVHPKIFIKISELKKLFLIFNKICILTEDKHIRAIKTLHNNFGKIPPDIVQFLDEFDYLKEQGIIFTENVENISRAEFDKEYLLLKQDLNKNVTKWKESIKSIEYLNAGQKLQSIYTFQTETQNLAARLVSSYLQKSQNYESYPILSYNDIGIHKNSYYETQKASILQIILKNIPVPDEKTSWEQLKDFRDDPLSVEKFIGLKNWINEISKGDLTINEIEDKISYLINDYHKHMKIHKMNTNLGFLETAITLPLQILENFVRIKWSDVAKTLFSFKYKKLALLKAEMQAPGRELSYIVYTQEMFNQ